MKMGPTRSHMPKLAFIPLPRVEIGPDQLESPRLVNVLDGIRFELSKNDPESEMGEVAWFIREYLRLPAAALCRPAQLPV
jgi:hypothetical protein